jgi:hypothetical protein
MIPDFNTYIKESHWSEMNRRSQGITRRKEDNVNLLKPKEFVDYLNNRYSFRKSKIFFGERLNTMFIPISHHGQDSREIGAAYVPDTSEIESIWIDNQIATESPELYDQIKSKFKITIKNENTPLWGYFEPPEGEELFSNLFLVKILDFIASLDTNKKSIKRK